jgi:hypothetical protein
MNFIKDLAVMITVYFDKILNIKIIILIFYTNKNLIQTHEY